jgi:DNA-binding transcriptional MerR regulator
LKNQKRTLTTGQLAKLHKINNRTLHYYDSIGLFSPNETGENGYRYYTLEQIADLELILAFRELGMSIEEIKAAISGNVDDTNRIVEDKISEIDKKMENLLNMKQLLEEKRQLAVLSKESKRDEIQRVTYPDEEFVLSSPLSGASDEKYYMVLAELIQREGYYRLYNHNYGIMLSSEKIRNEMYEDYDYFYIKPYDSEGKVLNLRPAGTYLRIVCNGDWDKTPCAYRKIRQYANQHDLELVGYAYERGLNETLSTNMDSYVTEIIVRYKEGEK